MVNLTPSIPAAETRTNEQLAKWLLSEHADYATTADGRLLINFQEAGVWLMCEGVDVFEWDKRESLVMLPVGELAVPYVTIANAFEWLKVDNGPEFCRNLMHIGANHPDADKLVDMMEKRFCQLLRQDSN